VDVWVIWVGKWLVSTYVFMYACETNCVYVCVGGEGGGRDTCNF